MTVDDDTRPMGDAGAKLMSQRSKADGAQFNMKRVPRWLWLLAVIAGVLMTMQCVAYAYQASGYAGAFAPRGFSLGPCDADRFCQITRIAPDSPAENAGLGIDDHVRLDRFWERYREPEESERVGLTLRRDGVVRRMEVATVLQQRPVHPTEVLYGIADVANCLIALLILGRAGRRWPSLLLALVLITFATPGIALWQNDRTVYPLFRVLIIAAYNMSPALLILALAQFRREVIGSLPRWPTTFVWAGLLGEAVCVMWGAFIEFNATPLLGVADAKLFISSAGALLALLTPLTLAVRWREVPPESRARYVYMWLAASILAFATVLDPLIALTATAYADASWPVVVQITLDLGTSMLFAYALLRHRVIDLGFAINRTLVFSTLSFLVLAAFGLVEWGAERLLPVESHEASVVIDAAIGLRLFLAFHRVHGWAERTVEKVFFQEWRINETRLQEFLRQAAYITDADVLVTRAVTELRRYTGGAEVALYRSHQARMMLAAGGVNGMPVQLDENEQPIVAMRADRTMVCDGFAPGDVALPMFHRADVIGMVVVGTKQDGNPFRADERAQLLEAVRRLGLELYSLRVDELERVNASLAARLAPVVDWTS